MTGVTDDFLKPTIDMFKGGSLDRLQESLKDVKTRKAFINWLSTTITDPGMAEQSWKALRVLASHATVDEDPSLGKISSLIRTHLPLAGISNRERLALAEDTFAKGLTSTSWVLMKKTGDANAIKSALDKWTKDPSVKNIQWLDRLAQDPTMRPLFMSPEISLPSNLAMQAFWLECKALIEIVSETQFWKNLEQQVAIVPKETEHHHVEDRFGKSTLPVSLLRNILSLRDECLQQGITPLNRDHFFRNVCFLSESGEKQAIQLPMALVWSASSYIRTLYQDALQRESSKGDIFLTVPADSSLDISLLQDLFKTSLQDKNLSDLLKLWEQADYLDTSPEIGLKIAQAIAPKIETIPLTEFDDRMLQQLGNLVQHTKCQELQRELNGIAHDCLLAALNATNPKEKSRFEEQLQKSIIKFAPVTLVTTLTAPEIAILKKIKGLHTVICAHANQEKVTSAYGLELSKLVLLHTTIRRVPTSENFPGLKEVWLRFAQGKPKEEIEECLKSSPPFKGGVSYQGFAYEGEFVNGLLNGPGSMHLPDKQHYKGNFIDGIPNGKVTMILPTGEKYEGDVVDGRKNGRGTMILANGEKYEGDFVHNEKNGTGTYTWPNGDIYEGEFFKDIMTGRGKLTIFNKLTYEGDFENNAPHGRGTYRWADGRTYEGEVVDSNMVGGTLTYFNGNKYVGQFVNSLFDGKGTFTSTDGRTYEGDWVKGNATGKGTLTWPDGRKEVGNFIDGKFQGN